MDLTLNLGSVGHLRGTLDQIHGEVYSVRDFLNLVKVKTYGHRFGTYTWNRMMCSEYRKELLHITHFVDIAGSS